MSCNVWKGECKTDKFKENLAQSGEGKGSFFFLLALRLVHHIVTEFGTLDHHTEAFSCTLKIWLTIYKIWMFLCIFMCDIVHIHVAIIKPSLKKKKNQAWSTGSQTLKTVTAYGQTMITKWCLVELLNKSSRAWFSPWIFYKSLLKCRG